VMDDNPFHKNLQKYLQKILILWRLNLYLVTQVICQELFIRKNSDQRETL